MGALVKRVSMMFGKHESIGTAFPKGDHLGCIVLSDEIPSAALSSDSAHKYLLSVV